MEDLKDSKEGIHSFGYDSFIGRVIFEEGFEAFVTLDLQGLGSAGYTSLEMACDQLCSEVRIGNKVLLYQSPGQEGPKTRGASEVREALSSALVEIMEERDVATVVDNGKGETYTTVGRRYEPLKQEQMNLLQKMYETREDMNGLPNPFDNQPIIN